MESYTWVCTTFRKQSFKTCNVQKSNPTCSRPTCATILYKRLKQNKTKRGTIHHTIHHIKCHPHQCGQHQNKSTQSTMWNPTGSTFTESIHYNVSNRRSRLHDSWSPHLIDSYRLTGWTRRTRKPPNHKFLNHELKKKTQKTNKLFNHYRTICLKTHKKRQ